MLDFLFSGGGYSPHGYCLAWDPAVLWLHIASDLLIALAYFSIPAVILAFLRRRKDPSLHGPAMLFVLFITGCGITHVMGVVTLYEPLYGLQGVLKFATAAISCYTAFILWRMLPAALSVPSRADLMRALRRTESALEERSAAEAALTVSRQELATSEERTRAIVNNVADGIIMIDDVGTIRFANKATCDVFGYAIDELIGANVSRLMRHEDRAAHDDHLASYLETGVRRFIGQPREVIAINAEGREFTLEIQVSELLLDGERRYTAVVRDISERKKMEKMRNEFISTVSHELRTPLTSIRGSLGLVASVSEKVPESAQKLVRIAENNCKRLIALVNDILDLEKLSSGAAPMNIQRLEVRDLTRRIVEDHEGFALEKGVTISADLPTRECYARADPDRFSQILANLISNAAKFSPKGGEVAVKVSADAGGARISVADRGPGVPEAFRGKIFDRFAQADGSSTRAKGGTGLGLHISRQLAELMGGELDYESVEGEGATFWFTVPASAVRRASSGAPAKTGAAGELPMVLHVEDDRAFAEVLSISLADTALVMSASSMAEARALLRAMEFAAVVIDWELPDGHGGDLLLDRELIGEGVPVFGLTANDEETQSARVIQNFVKSRTRYEEVVDAIRKAVAGNVIELKRAAAG